MERPLPFSAACAAKAGGLALAVAGMIAALFTALFAGLLTVGVSDAMIPFFTCVTVFFAAFCAGFCAARKLRVRGIAVGTCAGVAVAVLHTVATLCFGVLSAGILLYFAVEIPAAAIGGIVAVNLRR